MNSVYLAEDLVAQGGPSAPVWAFLTAITLGVIGLIGQGISARRAANDAKVEAAKAATNAQKAQENTASISNGFAGNVVKRLESIERKVDDNTKAFRDHLEWHLDKETPK